MSEKQKLVILDRSPQLSKGFKIGVNEAAFFYEPWLTTPDGKDYRYDEVPPKAKRAFADYLRKKGRMSPDEARMLVEWVREIKR